MKVFDKNLKAHKTTNIFYLIVIIPFLLLAILSATIMFNAKNAGGYANIFGYYVVSVPESTAELQAKGFFNTSTDNYKVGTKQMFKKVSPENISKDDVIVYYSKPSPTKITVEDWEVLGFSANISDSSLTNFEAKTGNENNKADSEIAIVKVGSKYAVFSKDGNVYTKFSYCDPATGVENPDVNSFILADDVIGVAVPSNSFIAGAMDYAKNPESLLFLVLLPCVLLLLIKFISLAFYHKYETSTGSIKRKGNVVDEQVSYSQALNANRASMGAPQRPTRISAVRQQTPTLPRKPPSPPPRPTRKG